MYSPVLIVHIVAGLIAVASGGTALFARKGSPLHRTAGKVFAVSMLLMAAGGGYEGFLRSEPINIYAGTFTFYLVATAWLTVVRKEGETGLAEWGLLLLALTAVTSAVILGVRAGHTPAAKGGGSGGGYYGFASMVFVFAAFDVRAIMRGGLTGVKRLVRHLWRMCFALFIATVSFFVGTTSDPVLSRTGLRARLFTKAVRDTHLPQVPVFLVLALTIFWLLRVQFSKAYRRLEP